MAEIMMREALRQAMVEEMRRDRNIVVLGEDVNKYGGTYGVTRGMAEEFGDDRIIDTPIAEGAIVAVALGAAMGGMRPIAELMTVNFSLLAMDQIVNGMAKMHYMFNGQITASMVLRTSQNVGQLGATHSQFFDAYFAHVPGLKVVTPSTPADAKGLLKSAIRDPNPVIFLEHGALYALKGEVPEDEDFTVPLGQSDTKREGSDVTLVSYARGVQLCLQAAEQLSGDGIEAEVVDLRTLRPLDMAPVLQSLKKTHRVLVVSDDWKSYGVSAEIAARLQEEGLYELDRPVRRVTQIEAPIAYAKNLEQYAMPNTRKVVEAAREML